MYQYSKQVFGQYFEIAIDSLSPNVESYVKVNIMNFGKNIRNREQTFVSSFSEKYHCPNDSFIGANGCRYIISNNVPELMSNTIANDIEADDPQNLNGPSYVFEFVYGHDEDNMPLVSGRSSFYFSMPEANPDSAHLASHFKISTLPSRSNERYVFTPIPALSDADLMLYDRLGFYIKLRGSDIDDEYPSLEVYVLGYNTTIQDMEPKIIFFGFICRYEGYPGEYTSRFASDRVEDVLSSIHNIVPAGIETMKNSRIIASTKNANATIKNDGKWDIPFIGDAQLITSKEWSIDLNNIICMPKMVDRKGWSTNYVPTGLTDLSLDASYFGPYAWQKPYHNISTPLNISINNSYLLHNVKIEHNASFIDGNPRAELPVNGFGNGGDNEYKSVWTEWNCPLDFSGDVAIDTFGSIQINNDVLRRKIVNEGALCDTLLSIYRLQPSGPTYIMSSDGVVAPNIFTEGPPIQSGSVPWLSLYNDYIYGEGNLYWASWMNDDITDILPSSILPSMEYASNIVFNPDPGARYLIRISTYSLGTEQQDLDADSLYHLFGAHPCDAIYKLNIYASGSRPPYDAYIPHIVEENNG
jgi:hypothetical protein